MVISEVFSEVRGAVLVGRRLEAVRRVRDNKQPNLLIQVLENFSPLRPN